jgi:hypothetical protein
MADVQAALGKLFRCYSQTGHHDLTRDLLVLDVDLSPLPASKDAEGSEMWLYGTLPLQDRAQTRAGNRHVWPHGGESTHLARSDLRDGEPARIGGRGRRNGEEARPD